MVKSKDTKLVLSQKQDLGIAEPWPNIVNSPIRNTDQPYLKFINSRVFSEEARHFLKYGYYTDAPRGTKDYEDYWNEQEKRCIEGYTVGGVRVTGRHYFYLNFGRLKARPIDPNTGEESETKKIITFPRFLDHNYYWFHEFEKCVAEGPYDGGPLQGMILSKARRKGITYQISAGVYAYNYNFIPASTNLLAAYEKGHFKVTLDGIHLTLNHLNKSTDWAKRRTRLNKRDHFRASFVYTDDLGIEVEDGFMSEVQAISFKDNPFKSIGESTYLTGFEEAGKFSGLLQAYTVSEPTFRDGDVMTGIPLIWGTGGDMEGGTQDFAEMFYNPTPYGLKAYENIYDENASGNCGWFIDDMWYYPGHITKYIFVGDKQVEKSIQLVDIEGNSYRELAEEVLDGKREDRAKGSRAAYNTFITQEPKTPAEAFLRIQGNVFDAVRCQARLAQILTNPKKYLDSIYRAKFEVNLENSQIEFKPDFTSVPLHEFPIKDNKNKPGCIEIYEHPIRNSQGGIPYKRYIAGIDSYDKDVSSTNSVGSILVLDTWTDRIVCHYKGRPMSSTFYENCRRILKYYNATANYERSNINIYTYFYNAGSVHLLTDEPQVLQERGLGTADQRGNNKKGTAPSERVNALGIELSLVYLNTAAYGADDQVNIEVQNYDIVRSVPLLKEFIGWNKDGNFDDVSAFGMLMIYREDSIRTLNKMVEKVKTLADDPFFNRHKQFDRHPAYNPSGDFVMGKLFNNSN